jgi:hypothetical protein
MLMETAAEVIQSATREANGGKRASGRESREEKETRKQEKR